MTDNTITNNEGDIESAATLNTNNVPAKSDLTSTRDMHKNVLLVSLCWALGIGSAFIQLSTSSLVAERFVGRTYSTIPVGSLFLVGCVSAFFVPKHQIEYGGRVVYAVATVTGIIGALMQFLAVEFHGRGMLSGDGAMALLVFGSVFQGYVYACTTRCRLLVTEFASEEFLPTAVSLVVGGGALGALIGPLLGMATATMTSVQYAGTYAQIMLLYFFYHVTVYFIDFKRPEHKSEETTRESEIESAHDTFDNDETGGRSLKELIRSKEYMVLVTIQASSYGSMAGLMLGTPLVMGDIGWDFNNIQTAMFLHLFGMFLPSLVTGKIISKIGSWETSSLGFIILLLGAGILLIGSELSVFYSGLTLIGVGWNFSFVAASAAVTTTYSKAEKSIAESFNDTFVLTSLGVIAVCAGFILDGIGWKSFVIFFIGLTCPMFLLTVWWTIKSHRSTTRLLQ